MGSEQKLLIDPIDLEQGIPEGGIVTPKTKIPFSPDSGISDNFLPSMEHVVKDLVVMKRAFPGLFEAGRGAGGRSSVVYSRKLDYHVIVNAFLKRMQQRTSWKQGWVAFQHRDELIHTIAAVEHMLARSEAAGDDASAVIESEKPSFFYFCSGWIKGSGDSDEIFYSTCLRLVKLLWLMVYISDKPCASLCSAPPETVYNCMQGWFANSDKDPNTPIPANATLPIHPDWMLVHVSLFETWAHYGQVMKWTDSTFAGPGVPKGDTYEVPSARNSIMSAYRGALSSILGQLRSQHDAASAAQAKLIGACVTVATTALNYTVRAYSANSS